MDSEWKRIPGKDNAWFRPVDPEIIAKMPVSGETFFDKYDRDMTRLQIGLLVTLIIAAVTYPWAR